MPDPQTATAHFFAPVAVAYLAAAALWMVCDWRWHLSASEPRLGSSDRPKLDLLLVVVAGAGIFLLGSAYRNGWLFPAGSTPVGRLGWAVDNLIIYSPIALVMALRRQGPQTVFLSRYRLAEKIAQGLVLGVIAVAIYCALRGEQRELPDYLKSAVDGDKLVGFLPVFLEGVAVVFAFVRLRRVVGSTLAIAIPSLLFAAAHVPGQLAEERELGYMALFFAFNTLLPAALLWVVARSRDVIWLGLVHYLMDIAIGAV